MKQIIVNSEFIEPYFRGTYYANYTKAVDIADHLQFHIDGYFLSAKDIQYGLQIENPYFTRLIDMRRPSESDIIRAYRRAVYLPKTKIPCKKVVNSLKKIVKSPDWCIDYSQTKPSNRLPDKETLQYYCEVDYPYFESVENWAYQFIISWLLKDPNAACIVLPTNIDKDKAEFYKPFSYIIPSKQVFDYLENEYIVYCEKDYRETQIIKVLTNEALYECKRTQESVLITEIVSHKMGVLPAFILGGEPIDLNNKRPLYDSFICGMLPELDAAAQDISDFQAEKVQHVFSTMWYFAAQECHNCHGSGKVLKDGNQVICGVCEGAGVLNKSPYKDMVIKQGNAIDGTGTTPTPPAGYITKPTEMVQLMEKIIENDIYNALSAINMEFLADTPLNESGKAKEVDRDELNTFVYSIGYHIVENILKPIYYYINEWRYSNFIPDKMKREDQLPKIAVPERFEILTENVIAEQYSEAITSKFSDEIILKHEIDYAGKRFANDENIIQRIKAKRYLDPFAGKTNEEKTALMLGGQIPVTDGIISIYIDNFISRAASENKDFFKLENSKQQEIIRGFAEEKLKEMKPSQKVIDLNKGLKTAEEL